MATEKTTAPVNLHSHLAVAHLAIRNASSVLGYVLAAERERGNTELADTLFIAEDRLTDALTELDQLDNQLAALKKAAEQ
jgi:hypothetical protein